MKTFLLQKTFRFFIALSLAFLTTHFTNSQKLNPPQKGTSQKGHALYKQSKIYDSQSGPTGIRPTPIGDRALDRIGYEQRMLQNPKTKEIPKGITALEMLYSEKITERSHASETSKTSSQMSSKSSYSYWENRGPGNVGGRTRALATDRRNENTIFAAGVSGGLWRSRDLGASWRKVTLPWQDPSITAIVQDPRRGRHNTWYYTAGERFGNSASAGGAFYAGTGVFKSVNNGRTWSKLNDSNDEDLTTISAFDIIHNIAVDPKNGAVYVATLEGIYRSQRGGRDFELVLPGAFDSKTDIMITPKGKIYATVDFFSGADAGFFVSDDGDEWTNITPAGLSIFFGRTVMAFDPSDEDSVYFFSHDLFEAPQAFLWHYQADPETPEEQWVDLSANLPNDIGGPVGNLNLQGDYNMMIRVHPTNPELIFLGGTNLYRSTTGFTTPTGIEGWIGGYNFTNDVSIYPNHHPDQHNLLFLPSDPNRAISANDGGVQITMDISQTEAPVAWTSLNNGYITTQPYAISYDPEGNSDDLLAGFQDNGTWFTDSDEVNDPWMEEFGGDGSYNAIADGGRTRYVSAQFGVLYRINYDTTGAFESFTRVQPAGGKNFDFVAPFILDPINDNIMYMPAGDRIWRNNDLDGIPLFSNSPTNVNWVEQSKTITPDESFITALDVSKFPVANVLYYGTSTGTVYRVENANLDNQEVFDISTGRGLPEGNINNVYVDPKNPDRVFITFSNYGIPSLFMTRNAGDYWVDISGNLEENRDGSGNGPSLRWFGMNGRNDGYFAATSTGLYFTYQLKGRNTKWYREPLRIGNGVAVQVKTRADGFVAAAIHGNGVYSANFFVRPRPEPTLSVAYLLPDKSVPMNFESFEVDITDLFVSTKRRPNIDIQLTNSDPDVVTAIRDGNTLKISSFAPDVEGSATIGLIASSGREQVSEGFTLTVSELAIYDQSGPVTFSSPSQNFLDFGGLIVQAADDFIIPEGATWSIDRLIANGVGDNGPSITDATVVIYNDANGLPGEAIYNSGSIIPTSEPDNYDLNLELSEILELGSGSYWLSVYTNLEYTADAFVWSWSTQTKVVGNEAVLRDDGVFFAGVTDWTPQSIVYNFTPEDQVFQIFGNVQEAGDAQETVTSSRAENNLGSKELIEVEAQGLSAIWPNPSTSEFFFSLRDNLDAKVTARVFNILGQMVYEKADIDATRTFSWNAAKAPSGLYLVKITGARTNNSFSIIKE